ncbi:alpha/beta hydrolase [Novosphingobium album (ex Liu et al. 2023)]|uniref:Alpha/beta hydrolase n=1 Tax=Novosphingobium album (ex Liu et al. 2023) TaxID=3031130 RepID=A0ABT5WLT0_9SPHN|nr:alpha/beta hydrolase [Novosphingobium album (ex Liu et al. 2023)]MDE8650987.1 alpha/beta hydrolase [Novosphingobium album (ex Liu et al. 2023)]
MGSKVREYRPEGPLDPVAAAVAQAFSAAPLSAFPIEQTRAGMQAACAPTREPAMDRVEDHGVPVAGGEIAVRLYRPVVRPAALIAWAHGGGFALGSIEELDNFSRLLAAKTGCAVASIEYRLAPGHTFPVAVEDVEAAVLWIAARLGDLVGDAVPLWLGGDSAGGNLATVVTRRLHAAGTARIAGNILTYPCTDTPEAESLRRFDPPFMAAEDVAWFIDMYLPDAAAREHPDFAPIRAADLAGLPPTLVVTAEHDILTEQGEAYAERLRGSGVDVEVERVPGMIHGFLTLDAFLPGAAGRTIDRIGRFIAART